MERITVDPNICNGKPTIRGMRITVKTILEYIAAGETEENILAAYPVLEKEDIKACLQFASQMADHSFINYPLKAS
ncbi:MAG: DUF433 domain-containing protein [Bacteroidales bacterium]|nr:DUF433 domain-containing protein [Bacteroidales bacterium]